MTDKANRNIARRPRDIADCVSACLQDGDLDGVTTFFHSDCRIYFPPGQPPGIGIDGARRAFADFVPLRPRIESDVFAEVVCGDIALLRANWRVVAGDGTVLGEGRSTEVAKQFEHGGWGYLIDCPYGPPNLIDERLPPENST